MEKYQYLYYVEYFCPHEFQRDFERAKKYEMEKFNVVLTEKDYIEGGRYYDTFLTSDNFITENQALEFAKEQTKKTKEEAIVRAGWFSYNEFNELELDELDKNYFESFYAGGENE